MPHKLVKIEDILKRASENKHGIFSNNPEPIVVLTQQLSLILEDTIVHLSEFVLAKVMGKIPELDGHPEITNEIILLLPLLIQSPIKILRDTRAQSKYLFIIAHPFIEIVIEVRRIESGKTEINTFHKIGTAELKRLERKFPVVL